MGKKLSKIRISVIIPVYNTRQYLQECIDSILNQSLNSIEIIIVDDGSTDGSIDLIKNYEKKYSNIRAIFQENKKQGGARNVGLKFAKGEYIYFIDSDDILDKQALEYCYRQAFSKNLDLVVFEADIFGNIMGRNPSEYLFHNRIEKFPLQIGGIDFVERYYDKISLLNIPFTLYSKQFLVDHNIYFLENTFFEDVAFFYKVMQYNPQIMIVDKVFYHRRYRSNSVMTRGVDETSVLNKIKVCYKVFEDSTSRLKELYCMIAIRGIRKSLQEIVKYRIKIENESKNSIIQIIENIKFQKKNITSLIDIQYCYWIVYDLYKIKMSNHYVWKTVYDYLENVKIQLQLYDSNIKLGIYGNGDDCKAFLDMTNRLFGDFKCHVVYIQTAPTSIEDNIYSVKDIADLKLDIIFIGSYYYENEMINKLYEQNGINYKIYSIKRDFNYFCITSD